MPRLSDAMEDGTITAWLVEDGQRVEAGQDLVEIETDKATVVYQAPVSGVLRRLLGEGGTAAMGAPIADLGAPAASPGRSKASPVATRRAAEAGIDLEALVGTGPRGQIRRRDIEAHLASSRAAAARIEISPAARRAAREAGLDPRQPPAPARRDGSASATSPPTSGTCGELTPRQPRWRCPRPTRKTHVQAASSPCRAPSSPWPAGWRRRVRRFPTFRPVIEIDMEGCRKLRASLAKLRDERPVPSYNDMVIRACAAALQAHPRVNGFYRDETVELHEAIDVGMAVAAGERLLVATVKRVDELSLTQLAAETRRLAARARDETITPSELSGATFTVSSLGMLGVDDFTAIINPPQATILAVGAVAPRVVVKDGEMVARATMRATLSADHRVLSGTDAAAFLATVRNLLEQPLRLLVTD